MSRNLKKKYKYVFDENNEDIIGQFRQMCSEIEKEFSITVDANYYINRYYEYSSESYIEKYKEMQENLYTYIKSMYPDIDFGIRGRIKSPFSYFEKILNKLEDEPTEPVLVKDEFANKIFIRARNCRISKATIDEEGPYITYGKQNIYIKRGDVLRINLNNRFYTINITSLSKSLVLKNDHIYVKTPDGLIIPIENGILVESNDEELRPYCYKFRDLVQEFYEDKDFEVMKQADYIAKPKETGYASLHDAYRFSNSEITISTETQLKTYGMEHASKTNPKQNRSLYKPKDQVLTPASIYKVPIYVLTTAFPLQEFPFTKFTCDSLIANPEQCWYYTFGKKAKENPEIYLSLKEKYIELQEKIRPQNVEKKLDELSIAKEEQLQSQWDIQEEGPEH